MHAALRTGGKNGPHLCSDTILLITEPFCHQLMDPCCSSFTERDSISGPAQSESRCCFLRYTTLALLFLFCLKPFGSRPYRVPPFCFLPLLPPFARSSSSLRQQVEQLNSFETDAMTHCRLQHEADRPSSFRCFPFPPANPH